MLVFKRAISLLLSLAMVLAPSLALGKNGTKSHKFVPQDKAAYQKQWATRGKPARKVASVTAASMNHGPFKSQKAALDSIFKEFKIKGERYAYSTIPGANGTAKAQILRGEDFESIFVDEYNTGTASKWEIKKGDTTVVADRPYQGRFSHIQITQPRAKSILKVDLQMNPDLKTYRLAGVKLDAYKVDHDQTNAMCASDLSAGMKSNITTMESFLADLQKKTSSSSAEAALTCRMLHNQKMLFDRSCYEGEFANSADDMARAFAKVYGTRGTSKPPRMLQCVENLGFAYQSAKMQADFVVMNNIARTETVNNGNWKPDQIGAETDCNRMDSIPFWNGTKWTEDRVKISDFFLSEPKPIRCDSSIPAGEAGRTVDGVVVIGKPSAWMAANRGRGSAVDGYAALFLHEFMHKTGLPEDPYETLVGQVQECCADPSIKTQADFEGNSSCQRAAKFAKDEMEQRSHRTEMGIYYPGYSQIFDTVQNRLQQNNRNPSANQFMSDWYDAIQSNPSARQKLDDLKACEEANPSNTGPCIDKAYDALKDFNNSYMSNQCKAGVKSGVYKDINCDELKNVFKTAMTNARANPQPIIDPAVPRNGSVDRQVADIIRYEDIQLVPPIDASQLRLIEPPTLNLDIPPVADNSRISNTVASKAANVGAKVSNAATNVAAGTRNGTSVASTNTQTSRNQTQTQTRTQVETPTTTRTQPSTNTNTNVASTTPQTNGNTNGTTTTTRTNPSNSGSSFVVGGAGTNTAVAPSEPTLPPTTTNTDPGNSNQQAGTNDPSTQPTDTGYVPSSYSAPTPVAKPTTNIKMASNSGSNILSGGSTSPQGYTASAAPVSAALINAGSNIGTTLGNYASNIASKFEGTAYASATAPRPESTGRQPAAVAPARRSYAGSGVASAAARILPTRLGSSLASGGGGNDPQPTGKTQAQALAAAPTLDAGNVDPDGITPQSRQAERASDARAIAEFEERSFRQPNDVVVGLAKLSPDALTREIARGESSPIIKTLRANGWSMTVSRKTRSRVLMSPSGRCYAPGRRGVVPLASCG